MEPKVKAQKDYLRTEASLEAGTDIAQLHDILKATKTNGKMVVLYNEGYIQGINIEQNSKLTDKQADEVRKLVGVKDKEL
jgi:hypothetical protein